ncbi:hypothetical protein ACHAPQ_012361 [Fusarium lateritium]
MRVGNLISAFALISFLSICFPSAAVYIQPWLHVFEGFALGSFFLLLCDYVSPHRDQRDVFFATKRKNGMKWFKTRWTMIFQMPIIAIGVAIATDITEAAGVFCEWSNARQFANIYLRVIMSVSLVVSVIAILQMYMLLKKDLAHHSPMLKLTAFKIVVGLTFLLEIVFTILSDQNILKPTDQLTYADVPFGIYAWLSMLNPSDSLKAILFIVRREDRREPSSTPVAMTGYNLDDALTAHPYNAQSYPSPHTNQRV